MENVVESYKAQKSVGKTDFCSSVIIWEQIIKIFLLDREDGLQYQMRNIQGEILDGMVISDCLITNGNIKKQSQNVTSCRADLKTT